MTPEMAIDVGRNAALVALWLAGPLLIASLTGGLIAGVLQAATQVQEQTLSFVAKLVAVVGAFGVGGYWMLDRAIALFTALGEIHRVAPGH